MNRKIFSIVLISLISVLLLSACGGASQPAAPKDEGVPAPAEYANLKNPLADDASAAAAGKVNYDSKCATCHGETGKGDGVGGAALNPKPDDLSKLSIQTDGFIYWRIAEGGQVEPFKSDGSAMPPWKSLLSEDEIWQLVTYIRTLK